VEIGGSADYQVAIRTCSMDFLEPNPADAAEPWHHTWYSARYARTIVHEQRMESCIHAELPTHLNSAFELRNFCFTEEYRLGNGLDRIEMAAP
jgi:hypothetical protein